jgi:hypothetical protein
MDAYKVLSTVRNGQLLIDMPTNFDNTDVEVIVLQVVRSATNDVQTTLSKRINGVKNKEHIEDIDNPVLTMSDLKSASKAVLTNLRPELEEVEAIIPARKKIDLTQLFGAFKNKMTIEEIDTLTKSWRNEWERDFS